LAGWARDAGIGETAYGPLSASPEVRGLVRAEAAARGIGAGAVHVVPRPLDPHRSELTWMGTVRRARVREAFGALLDPSAGERLVAEAG
jgi:hypothetical protein